MSPSSFDRAACLARSALYQNIRRYFADTQALEVEVPVLGRAGSLDIHLESMPVTQAGQTYYLQTSPELFMKRLLCEDAGDIFTITKAFRGSESGLKHNPEFSLLEWYRVGFSIDDLIDDITMLLRAVGIVLPIQRYSYADVFERATGIDPHQAAIDELQSLASEAGLFGELDRSELLDFLVSHQVEPSLPEGLVFIDSYPACQAELAEIATQASGIRVAQRFELYWNGIELANGYQELADADEQQRRFEADQLARKRRQLPEMPMDEKFLAALKVGMPSCAGVALGLDRLLMCMNQQESIQKTQCFSWQEL